MNLFTGNSAVSCYVDIASLVVMILLLAMSWPARSKRNISLRIYHLLCIEIAFTCVVCFVFNAMEGHDSPVLYIIAVISRSLWEPCAIGATGIWFYYMEYKLYNNSKNLRNIRIFLWGLFVAYLIVMIVNLYTGIVFTLTWENKLVRGPVYYVLFAVNFILFFFSVLIVWQYDRKATKIRFIHIAPMLLSVVLSVIPQFFTPYNTGIIGYVMGVTLLFFSIIGELRYVDPESGLYNKGYLALLLNHAMAEKSDIRSALIVETSGDLPTVFGILQDVLHRDNDVIRVESNRFLMFSESSAISTIQYLSSLVEEAAKNYNEEHADGKIQITTRCRMRTENEDPFAFVKNALDESQDSNEMRGIISMISELERLDKELTMASDIQKSILPVDFPDRSEFEIYAATDPAKEVGGDFYDFFFIDSDHLAMVIADVSDKGVPAAFFMMISKTLIKNHLMGGLSPAKALEAANNQLYEHNSSMMFVTVWLAVLDISTGKGLAVNAGHEKPALRQADRLFELLDYEHDVFAGVMKNQEYHQREFQLQPGNCILVYTDGAVEATNDKDEAFGENRLLDALNKKADASPKELVDQVRSDLNEFVGAAPQFDDITMLCLKFHGRTNGK